MPLNSIKMRQKSAQSVNCILRENTCFISYIKPNIWIKKTVIV